MKFDLFSSTLTLRENAAREFTVFAHGKAAPPAWSDVWAELLVGRDPKTGTAWPDELRARCTEEVWPQHAFGTANAGILVIWNRPRTAATIHTSATPHWTEPRTPILGGIPHTQIAGWSPGPSGVGWIRAWINLRNYLMLALKPFKLNQPLSAVMVASLNPMFGVTGESDHRANARALESGGTIEHITNTVQPLLTLVCGGPVQQAVSRTGWKPAFGKMLFVDHPTSWEGFGTGRCHGRELVVPAFAKWAQSGRVPEVE